MALQHQALLALQQAVGAEHVRTDKPTLASYCWNAGPGAMPGAKFNAWPAAVVMPDSTEQVAAVVKTCVAHGLMYRALSAGVGSFYVISKPGGVLIDLARMNRIVKIDATSHMAVIEPGVSAGCLQIAAMRQGMTCHIVGAGAAHSPLASATSFHGIGGTGASTGTNGRNMLALEWVTPSGDIVRIGSTGDDWFSEEGPGIGFRGMVRGFVGAAGGIGVFTRIGYKLYPWAGDKVLGSTGVFPQVGLRQQPNMHFYAPVWKTPEDQRDATYRLIRTGACFAMLRMPPVHCGYLMVRGNTEFVHAARNHALPEIANEDIAQFGWQILTMAHSTAQAAYHDKVVRHIVQETGGRFLDITPEQEAIMTRGMVTSQYILRVFRSNNPGTSYGVAESWKLWPEALRSAEKLTEEARRDGQYCTEAKEMQWSWPTESRQLWTENIMEAPRTVKGSAALMGVVFKTYDFMARKRFGMQGFVMGPLTGLFGEYYGDVDNWMRRIKRTFDPKMAADSAFYISPKKPLPKGVWPVLSAFLFSRAGSVVFRAAMRAAAKQSTNAKPAKPPV